ncbi:MAG: sugar phosphate isomerase/epimerase family protein [Suipraeoptans sp.]
MKYGIYYAYWEKEWGGDVLSYIGKVKSLGFDILEVACGDFDKQPVSYFEKLRDEANKYNIILTGGYGPRPEHNIASKDESKVERTFEFYEEVFKKMKIAGIKSIGGALYSFWPVDYTKQIDKDGDFKRSTSRMKYLADIAKKYDITLLMESLNRFEGYLINDAKEAIKYVREVDKENVKILLDTFHMNIEEDNLEDAIKLAGPYLAELHVGEANRRPPRKGRFDWEVIGKALKEISFEGNVVMEPFVIKGGQVGSDIRIWRNIVEDDSTAKLDEDVRDSLVFLKKTFE